MKKYIFTLAIVMILFGCQKGGIKSENYNNYYEDSNISISKNISFELNQSAENIFKANKISISSYLNISGEVFNNLEWQEFEIVKLKEENVFTLSKKANVGNDIILLSCVLNGKELYTPFITKIGLNNKVEYYFLETNQALSFDENRKLNIVTLNKDLNSIRSLRSINDGCGQAVMNCINDAYNNHGWTSVFAWVSSAFVPEVAAAIAAACIAKNCVDDCGCPIVDGKPQR